MIPMAVHIPHEVNQIKWVGAPGIPGSNRELMLRDSQQADPDTPNLPYQDLPRCFQVLARADYGYPGAGANFEGVLKSGGSMIHDMVVRQVNDLDASLPDPINAGTRGAKNRPCFQSGCGFLNQRAFQICQRQIGLLKFHQQIVEETLSIAGFEKRLISLNRTEIRANDYGYHMGSIIACRY